MPVSARCQPQSLPRMCSLGRRYRVPPCLCGALTLCCALPCSITVSLLLPYHSAQLGGNVCAQAISLERMSSALDRGPPEQGSQLLCTFHVPPCCPADVLCRGFQLAVRQLTGARRCHPQQLPHGRRQALCCARALSEVQLLQILRRSVGNALRCGLLGGAGCLTKQQRPAAARCLIGLCQSSSNSAMVFACE